MGLNHLCMPIASRRAILILSGKDDVSRLRSFGFPQRPIDKVGDVLRFLRGSETLTTVLIFPMPDDFLAQHAHKVGRAIAPYVQCVRLAPHDWRARIQNRGDVVAMSLEGEPVTRAGPQKEETRCWQASAFGGGDRRSPKHRFTRCARQGGRL